MKKESTILSKKIIKIKTVKCLLNADKKNYKKEEEINMAAATKVVCRLPRKQEAKFEYTLNRIGRDIVCSTQDRECVLSNATLSDIIKSAQKKETRIKTIGLSRAQVYHIVGRLNKNNCDTEVLPIPVRAGKIQFVIKAEGDR